MPKESEIFGFRAPIKPTSLFFREIIAVFPGCKKDSWPVLKEKSLLLAQHQLMIVVY